MRRFLTAFAAAVLMLSLGTADAAEYKKMTIRAATANPQGSLHVVAIDKFKEIVEKESNGAITVQTFYGGSLGDEQANVKQLRNAEIHLAVLADGNLTPFAPQAGVFILPYMFPKISDAEKLFGNEAFMNKTADAIAKQSRTRPLSWLVGRLPHHHQLQEAHQHDGRPQGPEDPRSRRGAPACRLPLVGRRAPSAGVVRNLQRASAGRGRRTRKTPTPSTATRSSGKSRSTSPTSIICSGSARCS